MGRGRKPTPTHLKVLHGNPGKRSIRTDEPKPEKGLPEPPQHLTAESKQAWEQLAGSLHASRIATKVDGVAFELLSDAYANYLAACKKVAEYGAVWVEKSDSKIPKFAYSPYWAVMNREWAKVRAMLVEFGMTPSSRTKVSVTNEMTSDAEEKFFRLG